MKFLEVLAIGILSFKVPSVAGQGEVTCAPNGDCGTDWFGYTCDCARARDLFIREMREQGFNCWENRNNLGVGCSAGCVNTVNCNCGRMSTHYWTGSCPYT
jgi:hypothetical protein